MISKFLTITKKFQLGLFIKDSKPFPYKNYKIIKQNNQKQFKN